jgi:putative hemolysin
VIDLASVNAQVAAIAAAVRSKKDAHVAACAHAIIADNCYPQDRVVSLVTKTVRDFRVRKLAEMGLEVKCP